MSPDALFQDTQRYSNVLKKCPVITLDWNPPLSYWLKIVLKISHFVKLTKSSKWLDGVYQTSFRFSSIFSDFSAMKCFKIPICLGETLIKIFARHVVKCDILVIFNQCVILALMIWLDDFLDLLTPPPRILCVWVFVQIDLHFCI